MNILFYKLGREDIFCENLLNVLFITKIPSVIIITIHNSQNVTKYLSYTIRLLFLFYYFAGPMCLFGGVVPCR